MGLDLDLSAAGLGVRTARYAISFLTFNLSAVSIQHVTVYKKYGSTCLSSVTLWNLTPHFWIADADAIKTITFDGNTFQKDLELVIHNFFRSYEA
jgi:hypothetical protein